jgi:hypothetical protein
MVTRYGPTTSGRKRVNVVAIVKFNFMIDREIPKKY